MVKEHIPESITTAKEKMEYMKVWAREFMGIKKKCGGYTKFHDGSWTFHIACDMTTAFWVLEPIRRSHKQYEQLKEIGICYTCTCPDFQHYFRCKHCLAWGLHKKQCQVPDRFSTVTVGKRKAPAGASLTKRSKALVMDC